MNSIFQKYPDIGDKILTKLDRQTLQNCQLVCKQWREHFEYQPFFWLKMLDKRGQTTEVNEAWKRLMIKSDDRNSTKTFANCLRKKFLVSKWDRRYSMGFFGNPKKPFDMEEAPPLHTAAFFGHFEIVKLCYDCNEDFDGKKITKTSENDWYIIGTSLALYSSQTEIAKFLLTKEIVQDQFFSFFGHTPLLLCIHWKNLELVKFMAPMTPNLDFQHRKTGDSLIHFALGSYEIFEYLVSLPGINVNLTNYKGKIPLQTLLDGEVWYSTPSHEDTISMVKILVPLAKNHKFLRNESPLHCAARFGSVDVLKIVVEYFEMYVNVRNKSGHLPIDIAIICGNHEAVQFLMEVKTNC